MSSDDGEVESDGEEELDDEEDSEDEPDSDSEEEPAPVAKPKGKANAPKKEAAKAVEPAHKPRREGAKLRREEEKEQEDDDDPSDTDDAQEDDEDEIVLRQDGREVSFTVKTFAELHLSRPLLRACQALGYDTPTPIQSAVVPLAMGGRDVCGSAKTGSGKTAAFMLPLLERLMHRNRRAPATRVLVLVPTRELAVQVRSELSLALRPKPPMCIGLDAAVPYNQSQEHRMPCDVEQCDAGGMTGRCAGASDDRAAGAVHRHPRRAGGGRAVAEHAGGGAAVAAGGGGGHSRAPGGPSAQHALRRA